MRPTIFLLRRFSVFMHARGARTRCIALQYCTVLYYSICEGWRCARACDVVLRHALSYSTTIYTVRGVTATPSAAAPLCRFVSAFQFQSEQQLQQVTMARFKTTSRPGNLGKRVIAGDARRPGEAPRRKRRMRPGTKTNANRNRK